jgi:thymidylate synthase (FAD)
MPKNNDLQPVKLPMAIRFGERPQTNFKNNLDSIKVTLMQAPSMDDLRKYLPGFANATWSELPSDYDNLPNFKKDNMIREVFLGKTLPTALETINLNFRIEGISLQEVTHIIRYRQASFSADCSGDKWWTYKDALVPNSIQHSNGSCDGDDAFYGTGVPIAPDDFHARYKQIVEMAKELYCDMIDSKKISIMDARYILPRCLETYYYMRISLKDALHFIKQRIDKQIQPETDNVIAYQMYCEILKQYPVANGIVDIHSPSWFYINTARTGKATNLYFPDADSDKFEWNENDFIYQCYRNEMNGTDETATNHFDTVLKETEKCIELIEEANESELSWVYTREAVM